MSGDPIGQPASTTESLAPWAAPYVTDMLGKGQALSNMPFTAYSGPLTAGQSPLQTQAFQGLSGLSIPTNQQMTYNPMSFTGMAPPAQQPMSFGGMNTAEDQARAREMGMTPLQYAQAGGMGANVDQRAIQADITAQQPMQQSPIEQYMSPYLQGALDPQYAAAQRQADISAQNLQSQYGKAGAYGGSRQGVAEAELQRGLLDRMAGITGTGYQQAFTQAQNQFNTEQDRQMQAARQAQTYGLEALGAQRTGGAEQRGIEGEGVAADYAQFREERDYPQQQTLYQQQLLQGLPIGQKDTSYVEPSSASGAFGILGTLAEIYKKFAE